MYTKKGTILLGAFVVVIALLLLTTNSAYAAPIVDVPVTVTQPDGTELNLLASGDEFYNWVHDAQGYTIMQDPVTGYYVYADLVNGKLVPTKFVPGKADPASVGLRPHLNISPEQKGQIRQAFLNQTQNQAGEIGNAPTTGTITNLVIFIRFSGESEFTDATSTYTNMLNSSTAGANSLRNYYQEVSYNSLTVNSTLLPTPGSTVVSYQDSHIRGYFQPYNATTNPTGYTGGDSGTDRRVREHTLLRDAINYVSGLGQFPSGASIDGDGDGIVDSVTFIVSGSPTGWSSLLWPHQWNLSTYTVTINGKTVSEYAFQLQSTINNGVLAHEMFHVLGAPDLYHYSSDGLQPVGGWDVMEADQDPPQHMGCYMKFKYGHWISSILELTSTGTYTLNPLTSSTNNCYKIKSPNSTTEYFVVEYRNGAGSTFESSLPGTGLLVYRINTGRDGLGNRDGPPDEVYIYRPGGTTSVNGSVNTAHFSSNVGRTAINDGTNPSSFLSNGSAGGLNISNVGASNATISFDIYTVNQLHLLYLPLVLRAPASSPPGDFNKSAPANGATGQPPNPTLSWGASSNATSYEYCIDTSNDNACTTWTSTAASTSVGLSGLTPATSYYWQVRANNALGTTNADGGTWWTFTTAASPPGGGIVNGDFESGSTGWTVYSTHGLSVITSSSSLPVAPHSGSYAAWLGGVNSEINYVQQQVTIPFSAPYLVYWQWIASADICGYDFGGVLINGTVVVDVYNLCTATNTGGWVTHSVNLSTYAGQSVTLQIRVETDSSDWSNLYVDDVSLQASASASGQINGVASNLDASTTQGKIGIVAQGEKPQGIVEKRLLNPR